MEKGFFTPMTDFLAGNNNGGCRYTRKENEIYFIFKSWPT